MPKNKTLLTLIALLCSLFVTSCYQETKKENTKKELLCEQKQDTLAFVNNHLYGVNYNFVVKTDSLLLVRQQPEEALNNMFTDSIRLKKHDHIVVVDIRTISLDAEDSVWVQVARDQETFGWVHEKTLLKQVVPNDPISQFISYFSDTHLLLSLVFVCIISISYLLYYIFKHKAKVVHFNDINSFYPTLLALIVASAATFYSSIQLFAPITWQHFYFHPTLNPFAEPPILAIFLCSVWAMVIVAIATIDDIYHKLPFGEATLYICGLIGICAIDYIVFSITTLYYIGYPLWLLYFVFSIRSQLRNGRPTYRCGQCGSIIRQKGKCPHCGTMNE